MQAITQKKDVVAKYLIENFSDMINSQNYDGEPPLILAAKMGNKTIIDILLKLGARLELRDSLGRSALRAAIDCSNIEIATFFITELNVDLTEKNKFEDSLLMQVSRLGNVPLLNLLLKKSAVKDQIDAKEIHGITALMVAVKGGYEEIVKILHEHGASINTTQEDGITPLMFAADKNYINLVKYLVNKGAIVDATDVRGNTALTYATHKKYAETIAFLQSKGAKSSGEIKPTLGIDAKSGTGYKILSIDGGGIRGIVAACILKEIEKRTRKYTHQLFDLIVGTSTGGIIALGLSAPNPQKQGKPLFTADEVLEFYKKNGEKIFSKPSKGKQMVQCIPYLWNCSLVSFWFLSKIRGWNGRFSNYLGIETMINLGLLLMARQSGMIENLAYHLTDKYSPEPLKNLLQHTFGNTRINAALTNVLITAYDVSGAALGSVSYTKGDKNHQMFNIALGTSAAPTYFPAFPYVEDNKLLIDGGVYANNPALEAYLYAKCQKKMDSEITIISIGTGDSVTPQKSVPFVAKRQYGGIFLVNDLINVLLKTSHVDTQMKDLLGKEKYRRLQVWLERSIGLDSVSPHDIEHLISQSKKFIDLYENEIDRICELLDPDYVKIKESQMSIRSML